MDALDRLAGRARDEVVTDPDRLKAYRLGVLGECEHLRPGRHLAGSVGERHRDGDADPHPAQFRRPRFGTQSSLRWALRRLAEGCRPAVGALRDPDRKKRRTTPTCSPLLPTSAGCETPTPRCSPTSPGAVTNYADPELEESATAYYRPHLKRLVAVKRHHDPDNFFRYSQSIPLRH